MNVLITGASGFLGRRLFSRLNHCDQFEVIGSVRRNTSVNGGNLAAIGSIDGFTNWSDVLRGQDVVVHTAALAHLKLRRSSVTSDDIHAVNVKGTINLARQAFSAGVSRFIFISSIGVNGQTNERPFTETDCPNPSDLYSRSKWEAEQRLWDLQKETGIEVVIVRPTLVYGPNAPGNFGALINLMEKGLPLPLGAIHNRRTFMALDNLVDLIVTCLDHPRAANQLFLASDSEDVSTSDMLRRLGVAMGVPARLIPVPASLLNLGAAIFRKKALARRLLGSLQVDNSKSRVVLGWEPPISVEEGLMRCFAGCKDR